MEEQEEDYSFDNFDDKPKRKHDEDPTTWADAFKAIGIFLATMLVLDIITSLIYYLFVGNGTIKSYDSILAGAKTQNIYIVNHINFQNPILMIVSLLLGMVFLVIALLIVYALIHVFATKSLRGQGKLSGLIVRANRWTTGTYLVSSIIISIYSVFAMNSIVSSFEGMSVGISYNTTEAFNSQWATLSFPFYSILFVFWLIWSIPVSNIVGKHYGIGDGKGCAAILMMNISLFVLFFVCSLVLGVGMYSLLAASS